MATGKQAGVKRLKMSERAQAQLELHFAGAPAEWLWQRKANDGYSTIPRTLPIVMQAIDEVSKGQPPGHTLFGLWARSPDHPLVTIENPATFAAEAGFSGERAVDTWRRRMKQLQALGLIATKKGPSGDFHFVLLLNPNVAVELLWEKKKVQSDLYARFIDRLADVGGLRDIIAFREYRAKAGAAATAGASAAETQPATTATAGDAA